MGITRNISLLVQDKAHLWSASSPYELIYDLAGIQLFDSTHTELKLKKY